MFRIFIKNCRLIAIAADYCHKSLFYTFTSISAVTCCRWGEQFVIFRCQVSLWCCVLKMGCCFSCSIHKIVSERSRETWYIVMELLHANYLVLAHELFCMFCKVIFHWRLELRRHIAFKFEALWHCTGVNRQLQMIVATAGVVEVSLYKRPRSAAGITSFLGWREEATADVALAFIRTDVSSDLFR